VFVNTETAESATDLSVIIVCLDGSPVNAFILGVFLFKIAA
jgi:hypothetical protein